MLVFKTQSHKKAYKDFTLADTQEGNSNISAGNNIHIACWQPSDILSKPGAASD